MYDMIVPKCTTTLLAQSEGCLLEKPFLDYHPDKPHRQPAWVCVHRTIMGSPVQPVCAVYFDLHARARLNRYPDRHDPQCQLGLPDLAGAPKRRDHRQAWAPP